MLGFQQVPPGHGTLSLLEEHRREPANSSVQCRSTRGEGRAPPGRLASLHGALGVTVNIQGRLCLRVCPVSPPPWKECVTMNVCDMYKHKMQMTAISNRCCCCCCSVASVVSDSVRPQMAAH